MSSSSKRSKLSERSFQCDASPPKLELANEIANMKITLPLEICAIIWEYLDVCDRVKIQSVCKTWLHYSRASAKLWQNTMYIRKDDSIRPDILQDYAILSRIKIWSNNMPFINLATNLQFDNESHASASKALLDTLIESGIRHLVLRNYEPAIPDLFIGNGHQPDDLCAHLRSLALSFNSRDPWTFFLQQIVDRAPEIEILSLSLETKPHSRALNLKGTVRHLQIKDVMNNVRALDLFDFCFFECTVWTGEFLRAAAHRLQYLTIQFETSKETLLNWNEKRVNLPSLEFLSLDTGEFPTKGFEFICPKLHSLQICLLRDLHFFGNLQSLRSLHICNLTVPLNRFRIPRNQNLLQQLRKLYFGTTEKMVIFHTVRRSYLMSLFPYLQSLTVHTKPELCDKWKRLEVESERMENKHQIESMIWYQVGISSASNTSHTRTARNVLERFANSLSIHTVDCDSFFFSPAVMGEFTKYDNVMEKRKLFFDESGEPRKDFLQMRL